MHELKYLDLYVATYTSPLGKPKQKLCATKLTAEEWLYNQYLNDLAGADYTQEQKYRLYCKWKKAEPWNATFKKYKYVVDIDDDLYD